MGNIRITEAEFDWESYTIFFDYGHRKQDNKLVEMYLQDLTDSIKVMTDFKVAKGNEFLSDGKKDLVKATKHKDSESKKIARQEILNAKEKIVHAKSWKARNLYKVAEEQLGYAKEMEDEILIKKAEESIKDAQKNLQESQVARADLMFDISEDRLYYAKREKNPEKITAAKAEFRKFRDIKSMAMIIEAKMNLASTQKNLAAVKDAEDPIDKQE